MLFSYDDEADQIISYQSIDLQLLQRMEIGEYSNLMYTQGVQISVDVVELYAIRGINPLSPHDALKHHFTSLKADLIFLQLRVF